MTENDADILYGIQARGNAIEVCGPQSGHTVQAIAFCNDPETASRIVDAIKLAARLSFGGDGAV